MQTTKPDHRVRVNKSIRSPKSGMVLPREGTLVGTVENLGRNLVLVDFGNGIKEYLFEHEIEHARPGDTD